MKYMETPCGRGVAVGDILVFKNSPPNKPKLIMVERLVEPNEVHFRCFGREEDDWTAMEYSWTILRWYNPL